MAGLVPFNRRNSALARVGTGFDDFYNMLDDFFTDQRLPSRSMLRDTFKIDIMETEKEYRLEAELPGVKKDEIHLGVEENTLSISVSCTEEVDESDKNYIHKERRTSAMCRRIRLANADLEDVKAKLKDGILTVTIPKQVKQDGLREIEIE